MSDGVIDRLRHEMKRTPNSTVPVYAGDVIEVIDELSARAEAAEAQLAAVRQALGGYPDSDLASLAATTVASLAAREAELESAHWYLDECEADNGIVEPLVDRITRLVSMLAADSTTTPAELDAVVDSHTVDALARRVDALELSPRFTMHEQQRIGDITTKLRDTAHRVDALEQTVKTLDDSVAGQVARLIARIEAADWPPYGRTKV